MSPSCPTLEAFFLEHRRCCGDLDTDVDDGPPEARVWMT
jgi:hypothetical protein